MADERISYPGFRWGYGPTTDWPEDCKGGPWHWVIYSLPDNDGMSVRRHGFVETEAAAQESVGKP